METVIINRPEKYTYSVPAVTPDQVMIGVPKIQRAFESVCSAFSISKEVLKNDNSRKRNLCMCRQAVWKIVKEDDPHVTLKSLGEFFGRFDHTTVIYGIQSLTNAMLTDEALVKKYKVAFELYSCSPTEYKDENYYDYADKL